MTFGEAFVVVSQRQSPGTARTTGRTITTWRGAINGKPCSLRIAPRSRVGSHAFLVNAGARLLGGEAHRERLQGGHFLDVEVTAGELADEDLRALELLTEAADAEDRGAEARPARARRRGERLRSGRLGADAIPR